MSSLRVKAAFVNREITLKIISNFKWTLNIDFNRRFSVADFYSQSIVSKILLFNKTSLESSSVTTTSCLEVPRTLPLIPQFLPMPENLLPNVKPRLLLTRQLSSRIAKCLRNYLSNITAQRLDSHHTFPVI